MIPEEDFGDIVETPRIRLRGKQPEWLEKIDDDLKLFSRLLVIGPGGIGKTTLFGALGKRLWERGLRMLVLENRDRLTRQTAKRMRDETGLTVDMEMGDESASPFAAIVVASVQSLGRVNRLTGFSDSHFGVVVADECHFSLAPQWLRILHYFHYGADSLAEGWTAPIDATYQPKASVVGFTATATLGGRKQLGEFYQHVSVEYSYLEAVRDGWLVAPVQKNIPVKIDLKKYKASRGFNGMDFKVADLAEAIAPIIEELAQQIVLEASDRKTIAFLPSVDTARMMAASLEKRGLRAIFVSGECLDADEKTDVFVKCGPGTVLCNAVLYNFGVDFPDVDCIAWFRATLSSAFYIQGIYRGTRVLSGIIDGCETAEERRAAIAASTKPNLLILDPLFVSDRIELCDAYNLFTDKPEVKERMKAAGPPTEESAHEAERDFIKALEKEARKHAKKAMRTINPLDWAISLGDEKLATYQPQSAWESQPVTGGQKAFLEKQHIDVGKIASKGLAQKVIGIVLTRMKLGLASVQQLDFMHKLGIDDKTASTLGTKEASALIDSTLAAKQARREATA